MLLMACIFLGVIWLMAKSEISGNIPGYVTHIGHFGEEQFIYSLTNDYIIEQEFISPKDFDFATINFSDHENQISGKTLYQFWTRLRAKLYIIKKWKIQKYIMVSLSVFLSKMEGKKDSLYS